MISLYFIRMIHVIIDFKVEQHQIKKALKLIEELVLGIQTNEPDTHYYHSFEDEDYPGRFTHVMAFKDEAAQQLHQESAYCRKFVERLYPMCIEEPLVRTVHLVASRTTPTDK